MAAKNSPRHRPAPGTLIATRGQRRMVAGAAAGTKPRAYSSVVLGGSALPIFDLHPNAVPIDPDSRAHSVGLALRRALRWALTTQMALVLFRSSSGRFRVWMHNQDYQIRYDRSDELIPALSVPEPSSSPRATDAQMAAAGLPAGEACALLLLRLFRTAGAARVFFELDFRPWSRRDLRYRLLFRDYYNAEVPRRYLRAPTLEQILLAGLAIFGSPRS